MPGTQLTEITGKETPCQSTLENKLYTVGSSLSGTYSFYHKDLGNKNDLIKLENIWKNGSFLTTFRKDFMKFPLAGRHLKVTSWDYAIFLYMENGKYQGFEVYVLMKYFSNIKSIILC